MCMAICTCTCMLGLQHHFAVNSPLFCAVVQVKKQRRFATLIINYAERLIIYLLFTVVISMLFFCIRSGVVFTAKKKVCYVKPSLWCHYPLALRDDSCGLHTQSCLSCGYT